MKNLIVIAYDLSGTIVGIVLAKSLELAYAYWAGAKLNVYSTKVVGEDFEIMEENISGVVPILKTVEVVAGSLTREAKIVIVKR